MGNSDTSLIIEMHRDIKTTLTDHGRKIDNIIESTLINHNEIKNIKEDILDINSSQESFMRKPNIKTFKFWFKLGGLMSAFVIAVYQAAIKIGK